MTAIIPLLLPAAGVLAQPSPPTPAVDDAYEIIKSYDTSERTSDGSSGNSRGSDIFLERVIAVRDGGLELEYDMETDATAEERDRNWQLPARVFRPLNGPIRLLNPTELEARLDGWLKAAGSDRSICGRWIFTWNAFRIDCDPQSVVETIEAIDLRSQLRDGATYRDIGARAPGILSRKTAGPNGATFATVLEVDPDSVRRARAKTDVATGEIMQEPVTLDAALGERAKERVSGTITVTFETDAAGNVQKRSKVTRLEIKRPDGTSENRIATETVERRRVLAVAARK